MAESVQIDRKLSDIFEEAFDLYDSLDECTEPTNSAEVQVNSSHFNIICCNLKTGTRKNH